MRYKDIYSNNLVNRLNLTFNDIIINSNLDDVEKIPVEKMVKKLNWEVKYGDSIHTDFKHHVITILKPDKYTPANHKPKHIDNTYALGRVVATEFYIHLNRLIEVDLDTPNIVRDTFIDSFTKQLIAPKNLVNNLANDVIDALETSNGSFTTNDIYTIGYRVSNLLEVDTDLVLSQLDIPGMVGYLSQSIVDDNTDNII